jgi:hypothetical protein
MTFDWTISVGNLLTGVTLFVGLVVAHFQNLRRLDKIEYKVNTMHEWFEKHVLKL